jgi:phosphatidylglycerol:prolipoprotein diacylglycerol transferase
MAAASITVGIDPTLELGPVTVAWHGLTIAVGILIGGRAAACEARRRQLSVEPLYTIGAILVVTALVGSRIYFLAEHGELLRPEQWLGTRGFTFYGGLIAAALGIGLYLWRARLSLEYLDVVALGLPLGLAVGRIGDVINGEHYGPATDFILGVRNTHPDADVPSPDVAYHSGGLYEMMIGLIVFTIVWPLRRRLSKPTAMTCAVVALLAAGRFVEFFARSDSAAGALGLEAAQWTSLALIASCLFVAWCTTTRGRLSPTPRMRRSPNSRPTGRGR